MNQRIAEMRTYPAVLPLLGTFTTAVRSTSLIRAVFVEVRDAEGNSGWGEATANWQVTGESVEGIIAAISGPIAARVVGVHPETIIEESSVAEALVWNETAKSAVDCAVHDLAARQDGRTLREHLVSRMEGSRRAGARANSAGVGSVLTDMTLSAGPPGAVVSAAKAAGGFSHIKIKVGHDPSHIDSVIAVREELGPAVRLRVDANQAWDAPTAIRAIQRWQEAGVGLEFVEQPTHARDFEALAEVCRNVDTPIVADESVRDRYDVDRLPAGVGVNLKLAKTGGLTPALELAARARAVGADILVGCMMESPVGLTSATALASLLPQESAHDLDGGLWVERGRVIGGITYAGERIDLSTEPGTGITGVYPGGVDGEQ